MAAVKYKILNCHVNDSLLTRDGVSFGPGADYCSQVAVLRLEVVSSEVRTSA